MKVIQYNKSLDSVTFNDDGFGEALDVGGMGPESIAIQLVVSNSSVNSTSCQLQGSIDNTNYFDLGSSTNITADGVLNIAADPIYYKHYRMKYLTTPVKSSLVNQSLTYTAVNNGVSGDAITITLVDPGGTGEVLSIVVTGSDIVVSLDTDGGGAISTTGNALKAALNSDPDASLLILVSGSNASALTALTETPLTGADGYFTVVETKLVYGNRI